MKRLAAALAPFVVAWLGSARAEAQVDSNLLRGGWSLEDCRADTWDKPFYILKGDSARNGNRYGVFHWDSYGRVKPEGTDPTPPLWFGYKLLTIDFSSEDKFLDRGLYDVGLGVAGRLGSIGPGWTLEAAGAAATANDGAFSNRNAIYPTATLLAVYDLGARQGLQLGVTYDGNGALLPALPLPVLECEGRVEPGIRLRAGFPHAEVEFCPVPDFSLLAILEYPSDARIHPELDLGGGFRVFGEFTRRIDPFHLRDAGRERVFYQLHTAEAGLRYVSSWFDASLSGGWAFSQELFTGYDLRDREHSVRPGDRPMIALTLQGTF